MISGKVTKLAVYLVIISGRILPTQHFVSFLVDNDTCCKEKEEVCKLLSFFRKRQSQFVIAIYISAC